MMTDANIQIVAGNRLVGVFKEKIDMFEKSRLKEMRN